MEIKTDFQLKDSLIKSLVSSLIIALPLFGFIEQHYIFWIFILTTTGFFGGCLVVNIIKNIMKIRKVVSSPKLN